MSELDNQGPRYNYWWSPPRFHNVRPQYPLPPTMGTEGGHTHAIDCPPFFYLISSCGQSSALHLKDFDHFKFPVLLQCVLRGFADFSLLAATTVAAKKCSNVSAWITEVVCVFVLGVSGKLQWQGNWISFMDTMLQFSILERSTQELYLPTRIQRAIINTKKHKQIIEALSEGEGELH